MQQFLSVVTRSTFLLQKVEKLTQSGLMSFPIYFTGISDLPQPRFHFGIQSAGAVVTRVYKYQSHIRAQAQSLFDSERRGSRAAVHNRRRRRFRLLPVRFLWRQLNGSLNGPWPRKTHNSWPVAGCVRILDMSALSAAYKWTCNPQLAEVKRATSEFPL